MSIHAVRNQIENTDSTKRPELGHAERQARITQQKTRLSGYDLTGPLECSHGSYDLVGEMLQRDAVTYLSPTKFGTRASEVAREKPPKEVVIGSGAQLTVTAGQKDDKCSIASDLLLSQAFTRRALAFDLMSAATFSKLESWHRFLFSHLEHPPVPGYASVSTTQIVNADKQAWVRLAELLPSLKAKADGSLPLDGALDQLRTDPSVVFLLLPLPMTKQNTASKQPMKRGNEGHQDTPFKSKAKKAKGGSKGKGKKGEPKMPDELKGLKSNTSAGERICWNYNLKHQKCSFAAAGEACKRGRHVCMKCEEAHPQYEHEMA